VAGRGQQVDAQRIDLRRDLADGLGGVIGRARAE
jgi:hypothetical protein